VHPFQSSRVSKAGANAAGPATVATPGRRAGKAGSPVTQPRAFPLTQPL
jgi:hypothetical protein